MRKVAPIRTSLLARFRRAGRLARAAALAGLVGLLLQVALPLAHPAAAASPDRLYADYRAAFGAAADRFLCATADGSGAPAAPERAHRHAVCVLCLAAQHPPSFLAPAGVTTPLPAQVELGRLRAERPVTGVGAAVAAARARGPPARA